MVDNLEVQSTASSEISDSLREQILGKGYTRRKLTKPTTRTNQSHNTLYGTPPSSYEVVPSKESSYEIISRTGSDQAGSGAGSFVVVSRDPQRYSIVPMKTVDNRRIETQSVAIQTVALEPDSEVKCRCCWGDHDCACKESDPHSSIYTQCRKPAIAAPEETSDLSNCDHHTDSSSQTVEIKAYNHCTCKCCNCKMSWDDYEGQTTTETDILSENSDDSYTTDFFDLPYQNNEEYLKLLRELEKKLVARNRERVRKTMMEFEKRSRQNQNLEKPVCDYNCDDSASLLHKLASKKNRKSSVCCKCGKNKRVNSDILQNEKKWDEMNFVQSVVKTSCPQKNKRIERSLHRSHWQLDPRSGEWVKVACFQQTDFTRSPPPTHGDYIHDDCKSVVPPPPPNNMGKKECCCRQRKRR